MPAAWLLLSVSVPRCCSQCEHWSVKRCCWHTSEQENPALANTFDTGHPRSCSDAFRVFIQDYFWSEGKIVNILLQQHPDQVAPFITTERVGSFFHPPFLPFCCVFSPCKYSLWREQRKKKQNTCLRCTCVCYLTEGFSALSLEKI